MLTDSLRDMVRRAQAKDQWRTGMFAKNGGRPRGGVVQAVRRSASQQ
jgi:hypothetical protein